MTKQAIIQAISDYKKSHEGVKYIRVCLPNEVITAVEVESIKLVNEETNEWGAIAAGGDNVGFQGSYIVEFKNW